MLSERFVNQIEALESVTDGVISEVEGYRQTVEDPTSLNLDPQNATVHNAKNLETIGNSLNAFGFRKNAIAVQEGTRIVYAGNGIVQWCIANGVEVCPVVWIPESMTETEAKAFALADNQSAKLADYDIDTLHETLGEVADAFTAEQLGFDTEEVIEMQGEMETVDEAIENMRKTSVRETGANAPKSGLVKLLFMPSELSTVEKALRAADKASRGEALTAICQSYLEGSNGEE